MNGRLGVGLVVVLLAIVACTAEQPRSEPSPTVEHPRAALPEDRDREAVLAALRELDLCAVLESVAPTGSETSTYSPFRCQLRIGNDFDAVQAAVDEFTLDDRLHRPMRGLGGAKAYVHATADRCRVSLPVSFRLAIEFDVRGGCGSAETLVADAVAVLAEPEVVRRDAVWDACTAMVTALDDDARVVGSDAALDVCGDESGIQFRLSQGEPGLPRPDGWKSQRVAETTVWTRVEEGNGCRSEWAARGFVAEVWARDCAAVTDLVTELVPVLREPPPGTAPLRPLLYPLNEPDSARVGACAYLEDDACEPYVEVSVPSEPTEIIRTAEADANVECAVALGAVTARFGDRMRPVTVLDDSLSRCVFVEPERLVQVTVNLWEDPADRIENVYSDLREVELAGHPGYRRDGETEVRFSVATSGRVDQPGTLVLTVEPGPLSSGLVPDVVRKAEEMLGDLLRAHFD